jgi:hypothetical protein
MLDGCASIQIRSYSRMSVLKMFATLLLLTIDDTSNLQQQENKVALEMRRPRRAPPDRALRSRTLRRGFEIFR